MKILLKLLAMVVITAITKPAVCQLKQDSLLDAAIAKPVAYVKDVEQRMQKVQRDFESKLNKKKAKILKEEQRIYGLFSRVDSSLGSFGKKLITDAVPESGRGYIPLLDSLGTSFSLMKQLGLADNEQIAGGLKALGEVHSSLQQAELFQEQLGERINMIKDKLLQMGKLKELKKLQEKFYYYQQQVEEYRSILNKPDMIMAKTLQLLQQSKLFKDFFARNSQLSQLFMMPGSSSMVDPSYLAGLQTVNSLQNLLQQRLGLSGTALQSQLQAPSPGVQQLMSQLQEKLSIKSGGEPEALPNFKPNGMKNRSVWQRIEFGTNLQAQRAGFFPSTLDIAATAAYKLSKKNAIGIGVSYKLGLGEVFKDVKLSHQGLGLRSFVEMQWKGNLFIAGGYEMNYRTEIRDINSLRDISAWQRSGLIGLNRKFNAGGKLTGNVQLLWDFLSYTQIPKAQPFVFRFGYTFNK